MQKEFKFDLLTSNVFLLIMLSYIILTLINVPLMPVFGKYLLIAFVSLIFILLVQKKFIAINDIKLLLPFIIFIAIYLINLNGMSDTRGLMTVFNQTTYMIIIYIVYSLSWKKIQIRTLSTLYYVSLPLLLFLIFVATGVLNKNAIGSFAFYLTFFPLLHLIGYSKNLKKSRLLLVFVLSSIVILYTDSRSIFTAAFFGLLTYLLWKFLTKNKFLYYFYFFLIAAFNYFIIVVYPNMRKWEIFPTLEELSIRYTGKSLMTGRNTIWAQLVDIVSLKPWLGYGSGTLPEHFLPTSLSAHNLYIQVSLQVGIIGLFFLVLFFLIIWKMFWKKRFDRKVVLSAAFLISIIVHQSFEVTLTQNHYSIGLLQWLIIAFGLSFALHKTKTEPE